MKMRTTILLISLLSAFSLRAETIVSSSKEELKSIFKQCDVIQNQIKRRLCLEDKARYTPFALIPHKPNYFIISHNDGIDKENATFEETEIKFQISFKSLLYKTRQADWRLYFGYTQLSLWQMFNQEQSSPFRETNYEPELMLYWLPDYNLFGGWTLQLINFGFWKHQSNGQSQTNSRSWDRHYLQFTFTNDPVYVDLVAWQRRNEPAKAYPEDPIGDDNADIEEYLGKGELRVMYRPGKSIIGLLYRDTLDSNHRRTYELGYSYPLDDRNRLRIYAQYFKGYGESLIDYNIERERFGVGIMLSDWL